MILSYNPLILYPLNSSKNMHYSQYSYYLKSGTLNSKTQMLIFSLISLLTLLLTLPSSTSTSPELIFHQTPIFGNISLGYYCIHLFLGTPSQKQTFILDTGSSNFVVPCSPCQQCGTKHMNPYFDHNKSTTAHIFTCSTGQELCKNCHLKKGNDSCEFNTKFVEQSEVEGYYIKDMVLLTPNITLNSNQLEGSYGERVQMTFGCITKQTNLFKEQKADGILALSPNSPFNLVKQMYRTHYPFTKQNHTFSICLSDNGGVFTVGGLNKRLHRGIQGANVRFRKNQNVYSLNISGISVGNVNMNVSSVDINQKYGIFIDSGATYTYFQHSLYASILNIITSSCQSIGCTLTKPSKDSDFNTNSKCFKFYESKSETLEQQIKRFPNITLKVGRDDRIDWEPGYYFVGKNVSNREVCLAFQELDRNILGTTWMRDRDVHFDMNREEITIFDADCKYQKQENDKNVKENQNIKGKQVSKEDKHEFDGQNVGQDMNQSDENALIVSLVIVVVLIVVTFVLIVYCRLRNRRNKLNQQSSTIVQEPASEVYHDEISITDLSQEHQDIENSARNIQS